LGWRELIAASVDAKLVKIVERIHVVAEGANESVWQQYLARHGKIEVAGIVNVNPLILQHQFGAFSDHIVFSMPASYGPWFVHSASKLVVELLHA
jgi:hypothetical protein